MAADALFRPFRHGSLELPTRIVMAPMTRKFCPENVPGDDVIEYYRKRAAAGVGLILTEGTTVDHPAAEGYLGVPYFHGEAPLAGWKRVVDAVHAAGGKIAPQLWHIGNIRRSAELSQPEVPAHGPMERTKDGRVLVHGMLQSDIDATVAAFAKAAADAKRIGMDAIELHGAHGYLIDQFFWEGTNRRTDDYGGDMARRSRFAIEIVQAVRAAVGPDFPVILRFSQWKQQDYEAKLAADPQALEDFLGPLSDAGVDIFHCSTRRFWEPEFQGSALNLAGWTRKLTGKPSITVGSVGLDAEFIQFMAETDKVARPASLDGLIARLEAGEFDLVAVGRALISDPEWARKVREGRDADILPFSREALATLD